LFSVLIVNSGSAGNLVNSSEIESALSGCTYVIHVASPNPLSRNADLFQKVNVDGTRTVLESCLKMGVKRFVYTSSASVVFDGTDQKNLDETAPAPMTAMDDYTKTKYKAEQLVLQYNSEAKGKELYTCSIRPHGIFGPRDPHFFPALGDTGKRGKSKFLIGDGSNLVDFTYVENVAYAHILAAAKLNPGAKINGQAYFITNREPVYFWGFIGEVQRAWGWTVPFISMPTGLMRPLAGTLEKLGIKSTFTTQAINYSGSYHYYSAEKAVREMGYHPPVSMKTAMENAIQSHWSLRNTKAKPEDKYNPARDAPTAPVRPGLGSNPLFKYGVLLALWAALAAGGRGWLFWVLTALIALDLLSVWKSSFGQVVRMYTSEPSTVAAVGSSSTPTTILISGANRGLGLATALDVLSRPVAKNGLRLLVACRKPAEATKARESLESAISAQKLGSSVSLDFLPLDLGNFSSIRALVAEIEKRKLGPVDVLINNAGAMCPAGIAENEGDATKNDLQFQSNYLGHFYLTNLLVSKGELAPAARVVNVSSMMHRLAGVGSAGLLAGSVENLDHIQDLPSKSGASRRNYSALSMYCKSKLAQILWTAKQQKLWDQEAAQARVEFFSARAAGKALPSEKRQAEMSRRTIVAVNPGAVATDFIHHFLPVWMCDLLDPFLRCIVQKTPAQGVQTVVYAALSQEMANVGGVYVDNCALSLPSPEATDEWRQEQLWRRTKEWCPKIQGL
jgi:sterol-4alpha-carboxylate 3-dehydrogenase (decarboxylating)